MANNNHLCDYTDEVQITTPQNCTCPETNNVYMEEENIGVNIVPGYFYYDKNAPKQNIQPDGGERINLSTNSNKKIYDKIKWVNHDNMASNVLAEYDYNIEPNDNKVYKDGKFNADSTYTVNHSHSQLK